MNTSRLKQALLDRFECQQSGHCCRAEGFVYVTPTELTQMASYLKMDLHSFKQKYTKTINGHHLIADRTFRTSCFLDDCNRCQIYPVRPNHCRTYPQWPEIWRNKDTILHEIALCPGLKKAFEGLQEDAPDLC